MSSRTERLSATAMPYKNDMTRGVWAGLRTIRTEGGQFSSGLSLHVWAFSRDFDRQMGCAPTLVS